MNREDQRRAETGLLGNIIAGYIDRIAVKSIPLDWFMEQSSRQFYAGILDATEDTDYPDTEGFMRVAFSTCGMIFFDECLSAADPNTSFDRVLISEYMHRLVSKAISDTKDEPTGIDRLFTLTQELEKIKAGITLQTKYADHEKFLARLNSDRAIIQTKIPILDETIGGFCKGEITIIAGRPSMGKTAYAATLAYNIAQQGYSVDVYTFEMEDDPWRRRIVARVASVPIWKMRNHTKTNPVLTAGEYDGCIEASRHIDTLPIYVYTTAAINIDKLVGRMAASQADVIIIDYLGLVVPTIKGKLTEQMKQLSNAIANATRRYHKSTLLLCQLNRDSEREKRAPTLIDLRDSGEIEQDADAVHFVHEPDKVINRTSKKKVVTIEIHVAKMKDGNQGIASMKHARDFSHFYEQAEMPDIPELRF